ncbi:MAG: DUF975 family protein, partial [Treponemataceae bacterium]
MFFNGSEFKHMAKRQLKGNIFISAIITAITIVLSILLNLPSAKSSITQFSTINTDIFTNFYIDIIPNDSHYHTILSIISSALLGTLVFAQSYFFLHVTKRPIGEKISFDIFLDGLNYWFLAIRATLWTILWLFLWSFIFFIPAIVKGFAYSQIFFILCENPHIGVRKALKMSILMTHGHKWDLLVLCLSFIGWMILSALTGGLLLLWLSPYMMITNTNAYYFLKKQA